jgi:hypothetical protein
LRAFAEGKSLENKGVVKALVMILFLYLMAPIKLLLKCGWRKRINIATGERQ